MFLKIENEDIKEIYKQYLDNLNLDYEIKNDEINVKSSLNKLESLLPLQYSITVNILEQIIYFLQLLHEKNYTIIHFNIDDFMIGINYNLLENQKGGSIIRIEDKLLDEDNFKTINQEKILFILFVNLDMIIPIDETNKIIINNNDILIKNIENNYNKINLIYKNYKENDNCLEKIKNKVKITNKIGYYSLGILIIILLLYKKKGLNISNIEEKFKLKYNNTPLYYCILRLIKKDEDSRFLFYL